MTSNLQNEGDLAGPEAMAVSQPLALRSNTKIINQRTYNWDVPVPAWEPVKQNRNSSVRFACIAEDRISQGLDLEGELLVLTPGNWKQVLRYAKPSFLLMESFWISSTGHWHMGQHPGSSEYGDLLSILELSRELSIPTVFWITKGNEYHEHYKDFARNFDHVFCADPLEIEKLAREGLRADLLLPCAQPALHNPFRHYEYRSDIGLNILFDGWADIDRLADKVAVLRKLIPYGLDIIESRYQMFRNRLSILPEFKNCIRGCVTERVRATALKYAKAYVTLGTTLSTRTTQQWMSLEAAASYLPVVHLGALPDGDVRKDIVIDCGNETDFLVEFVRYREDPHYRERVAHLGWRAVNLHHTYSHRLRRICRKIGIPHDWEEFPKASLITPTYRTELLPRCLANFNQIEYPNKELVLAFNGDVPPSIQDLGLTAPQENVSLAHVPGDMFAGATLNMGHLLSKGKYCFRIDDDDHYGPNYVLDMILQARSVGAELFGKSSAPLIFEGEKGVYVRNETLSLVLVSQEVLQTREVWFGGNSIAGTSSFFKENGYSDRSFGAADTELVLNLPPGQKCVFAIMDRFNLAAERRQDLSSHTWKYDQGKLKEKCHVLKNLNELLI